MERWSYKPEVEGLNPSLGTKFLCASYRGVTHSGRTVTAAIVEFEEARRPHAPATLKRRCSSNWKSGCFVNSRLRVRLPPSPPHGRRLQWAPFMAGFAQRVLKTCGRTPWEECFSRKAANTQRAVRNTGTLCAFARDIFTRFSPFMCKAFTARVPGIGLLNRTLKSWAERHEVQFLRGLPKLPAV